MARFRQSECSLKKAVSISGNRHFFFLLRVILNRDNLALLNNPQGTQYTVLFLMPKKMKAAAEVEEAFIKNEDEEVYNENEQRNLLTCFSCDFVTENIDELDEHILVNHDDDDDDDDVGEPEQKFQIIVPERTPAKENEKKRKFPEIPKNLPKNIPRAKIIVKHHDPKFTLCTDSKNAKIKGKPNDDSKFSIGSPTSKRAKRTPAEEMQCHLCSFVTRKKSVLATHMLNHSDVIPPVYYKCSQCPYQTKRKNDMPKHMLGHCSNDSVPLYKCSTCPYVTKRKGDLPKHEMNHVERSQVFSWNCSECEYFSKRKNDLHKHMLIHSDRQLTGVYKCLKCAYATDKVVKFSRHVLSKCSCWDDPISLEHLMLEDILASVDKNGVHVVLGGDSDEEHHYVEGEVQYVEGGEDVEYVEYSGSNEVGEDGSGVIIEGEVVDEQFGDGDQEVYVVEEPQHEEQQDANS